MPKIAAVPHVVQHWLASLDTADHEAFLDLVTTSHSPVEVWTLATVLGYAGSFGALADWSRPLRPAKDRRQDLSDEVDKLKLDLVAVRGQTGNAVGMEPQDIYMRIGQLTKELRGHLIEIDKMTKATDRRGLVLAGADRVIREVRSLFAGDKQMEAALDDAFRVVWAVLSDEK
jgi:hypothetical protein